MALLINHTPAACRNSGLIGALLVKPGHELKRQVGVTLLELMCALAVVAILVGLLLGPIQKARRRADLKLYQAAMSRVTASVREDLQKFYQGKPTFPAWTAEDLHDKGVLDAQVMRWIRAGWVQYYPFSSTDPDAKLVMLWYEHTEPHGVTVSLAFIKSNIVNYVPRSE